jgi:hypothetical protein
LRRFGYSFFCDGGLRGQRGQAQHSKGSILHCRGEAEILYVSSEEAENLCEKLYAPRLSPGLKLRRYQRRSDFSCFTIAVGGDADVPTIRCNVGLRHFTSFAAVRRFGWLSANCGHCLGLTQEGSVVNDPDLPSGLSALLV